VKKLARLVPRSLFRSFLSRILRATPPHSIMDEEYHPQPLNGYVYSAHGYIPGIIEPCATLVDEHGEKVCNVFHLLTCGHIIALDEKDQRCGTNCQHTATLIASSGTEQVLHSNDP
jgi:hypothetical protein